MKKGCVFSDLHMFSRRSSVERCLDTVYKVLEDKSICVLNGDIFDFRWTTLPSIEETVQAAADWLSELALKYSKCKFHYVLGNHDMIPAFQGVISELVGRCDNLRIHRYGVRYDNTLFIHGDVCEGYFNHTDLDRYRIKFAEERPRSWLAGAMYELLVRSHLHKAVYLIHPREKVADKIVQYLSQFDPNIVKELKRVYFGHTHVAFSNFIYKDLEFHNTGSAIRGLKFNLSEFDLEDGGKFIDLR